MRFRDPKHGPLACHGALQHNQKILYDSLCKRLKAIHPFRIISLCHVVAFENVELLPNLLKATIRFT
jgi:hypothetical protein